MRLTFVDESADLSAVVADAVGVSRDDETIAELLRAEVTSRGHCTRSVAVRRAVRALMPAAEVAPESVADLCSQLERAGDFQESAGGVLFATPLRAIELGDGEWRVAASMPVTWLRARLPGDWKCEGIIRRCRLGDETEAALRPAVAANGGVVISPETWAGFDRTPAANANWVSGLDARLQNHSEPAASLERNGPLAWNGLIACENQMGWRHGGGAASARLWRTRSQWGYWAHAWTGGGPPSAVPFHQLRGDEGSRTVFAVASEAGMPIIMEVAHREGASVISFAHWLPSAEYRFLAVSALERQRDGARDSWSVPRNRIGAVIDALRERLGVLVRELPAS